MADPLETFKGTLADIAGFKPGEIMELREAGLCILCKELAMPKCYSPAGRREYIISGTCEKCFDAMFGGTDG